MNAAYAPVSTLSAHQQLVFLAQLTALLATAMALGRLAALHEMPALVGEILAGVLLGPSVLGHLAPTEANWLFPAVPDQMHLLDAISQFSVLLLVGLTGAHLDLRWARRNLCAAAGISTFGLVVPLLAGIALATQLPDTLIPAGANRIQFDVMIGIALCVSAIPVMARILTDLHLLHRDLGQLMLAAAAVDDSMGWLLLSVVAASDTGGLGPRILAGTIASTVVVTVIAAAARPLASRLLRAADGNSGSVTSTAVLMMIAGAALTQAAGLEPVLGAFLAGALISGSHLQPNQLNALHTLVVRVLSPVFLATAGLRVDLTTLATPTVLWATASLIATAVAAKVGGAYLGARLAHLPSRESLTTAAGLNARGIIQIVIASIGLRMAVFGPAAYTAIVLVAITTSVMTGPALHILTRKIPETTAEELRAAQHTTP
jgi:Kef-type K+ transport system membrane component KefB